MTTAETAAEPTTAEPAAAEPAAAASTDATATNLPRKRPFIYTLLKVAEPKWAAAFRNGSMYMNTLKYFRELKNGQGELIGDPLEGVAFIGQPEARTA